MEQSERQGRWRPYRSIDSGLSPEQQNKNEIGGQREVQLQQRSHWQTEERRQRSLRHADAAPENFFAGFEEPGADLFWLFHEVLIPSIPKLDLTELESVYEQYVVVAPAFYRDLLRSEDELYRGEERDLENTDGALMGAIRQRIGTLCAADERLRPRAEQLLLRTLRDFVDRHVKMLPEAMVPEAYQSLQRYSAEKKRILQEQEARTGKPVESTNIPEAVDWVDLDFESEGWERTLRFHEADSSSGEGAESIRPVYESLQTLGEIGSRDSVDFMVDWARELPGAHPLAIADACSAIDAPYAGSKLMALLREVPKEGRQKFREVLSKGLSIMLYRLELGRLNISRDGVEYLQRRYDLGVYNDPSYFAKRITADGKVGIFGQDEQLLKYFELGDLARPEASVQPRILDIVYETLYFPRDGESSAERAQREAFLEEFQRNYFGLFNDQFFKETGVAFNNLGMKEQGQFLAFHTQATEAERQRATVFVQTYRESGLRAFLSMDQDPAMGRMLLEIGEQSTPEVAGKIFAAYSQIVDATQDICQYVERVFGADVDADVYARMNERLLERGKLVLREVHEQLSTAQVGEGSQADGGLRKLRHLQGDLISFATIAKALHAEGEINALKECLASSVECKSAMELSSQERADLLEILTDSHSTALPTKLAAGNSERFAAFLQDQDAHRNTVFHLLKHDGKIAGFMRFDHEGPEQVHGASFNMRPSLRDSALGMTFLTNTLEHYRGRYTIRGEVWAANPALPHYLAEGAVGTGAEANYSDSGEVFLHFEIPKKPLAFEQGSNIAATYDLSLPEEQERFAREVDAVCRQAGYRATQCMRAGRGSKEVTLILQKLAVQKAGSKASKGKHQEQAVFASQ